MRIAMAVLVLALAAEPSGAEEDHSAWWYARAKIACLPDAARLCASVMPDPDRVRDCMKDKKHLVSEDCAGFYPGGKNAD